MAKSLDASTTVRAIVIDGDQIRVILSLTAEDKQGKKGGVISESDKALAFSALPTDLATHVTAARDALITWVLADAVSKKYDPIDKIMPV